MSPDNALQITFGIVGTLATVFSIWIAWRISRRTISALIRTCNSY